MHEYESVGPLFLSNTGAVGWGEHLQRGPGTDPGHNQATAHHDTRLLWFRLRQAMPAEACAREQRPALHLHMVRPIGDSHERIPHTEASRRKMIRDKIMGCLAVAVA